MEARGLIFPSLVAGLAVWLATGSSPAGAAPRARGRALVDVVQTWVRRWSSSVVGACVVDLGIMSRQVTDIMDDLGSRGIVCAREAAATVLVVLFLLAAAVGLVVSSSAVGALAGIVAIVMALMLRSSSRDRAERIALSADMPEVFRSLAVAIGSGKTLSQAIEYVGSHGRGRVGESFSRAALGLRCGMSVDDVMAQLQQNLDAPGVPLLVCALGISQRTGSPLQGLFSRAALLVEGASELERSLSVKTAQVRMSVRVVCLLPAVLVVILSLVSPDFRAGVVTPVGGGCVVLAAVLDGVAVFIIRRLLAGVL